MCVYYRSAPIQLFYKYNLIYSPEHLWNVCIIIIAPMRNRIRDIEWLEPGHITTVLPRFVLPRMLIHKV